MPLRKNLMGFASLYPSYEPRLWAALTKRQAGDR
jgi:hypothetical protein